MPYAVESEVPQPIGLDSNWRRGIGIMSVQGTTRVSSYVMMLQNFELSRQAC